MNRIRDLREDNDLNQAELAKYLFISRSSYRDIETKRTILTIETVEKLVLFYNTSFEYILDLTNINKPLKNSIYKSIMKKYNINYSQLKKSEDACPIEQAS